MWLMPSRNRPAMCQEALDCIAEHGSTPGLLYVHAMTPVEAQGYENIRLPPRWRKVQGESYRGDQNRWFYAQYPDEPWYGVIADDNYARTPGFDERLIEAAGDWCFAYCNGGRHKTPTRAVKTCPSIPSCMVWGGKYVNAVGWFAPPGVVQATIDEHWRLLSFNLGVERYLHDVVVEHKHWISGGREKDETDREPKRFWAEDFGILENFVECELKATARRVRQA